MTPRHQTPRPPAAPGATRRTLLLRAGSAALAGTCAPFAPFALAATADGFPDHPVRMIVPLPAGGASDVVARLIAQKLGDLWKQGVVVDNRPGAGTLIGSTAVARAPRDGYTFGMVISAHVINPSLRAHMPYDTVKDFTPLTLLGFPVMALVAHPSVAANDVKGLVQQSRQGAISYASLGIGTATHLAGELLKTMTGADLVHVPYNGSAPAYTDMLTGRVPVGFVLLDSALPYIKDGRLKVLGLTSSKRSAIYPQYPTIAESLPGYALESMFGFVAPSGLPAPVAAKLSRDLQTVANLPEVRERMSQLSIETVASDGPSFGTFIDRELKRWAPVVKASGARVD